MMLLQNATLTDIRDILTEFEDADPVAYALFVESLRNKQAVHVGALLTDFAEDWCARTVKEEPAHSTESLDFARRGSPAMDKCFKER